MTLAELLDKYPEYANLDVAIDTGDDLEYVGKEGVGDGYGTADVFLAEDEGKDILVFSGNWR